MTKAVSSLNPPSAGCLGVLPRGAGLPRCSPSLEDRPFDEPPQRGAFLSAAASASGLGAFRQGPSRPALLAGLERRVREIERHASLLPPGRERDVSPWRLGVPALDLRLGLAGLSVPAVHELKPVSVGPVAGARAAALGFLLRLAAGRIAGLAAQGRMPRILVSAPAAALHEMGRLYGPGLAALGLDPRAFLLVETAREAEALWAVEEGLRSGSVALAVGILGHVALTPARRLSLAAEEYRTPCLLLTGSKTPAAGATATRWRIAPAPSAPQAFDPNAPGSPRYRVSLERCRMGPPAPESPMLVEWLERGFRPVLDGPEIDGRPDRNVRRLSTGAAA